MRRTVEGMLLRRGIATLLVVGLAVLAGCGDDPPPAKVAAPATTATAAPTSTATSTPDPAGSAFPTYVALGDSYTAAPGVPQTEQESGCLRSTGNYPQLVAAALGTSVDDVSCAGATTLSLVGAQQGSGGVSPPQFQALTSDTSLVTMGIGGNDLGLFATLVGTCAQLGYADPSGSPCRDKMQASGQQRDPMLDKIDTIGQRVAAAVAGVHDRAPDASVVLVGYPQLVPEQGTCPILPLAAGDYPYVRSLSIALNDALKAAAQKGDATFIDLARASRGHDICAGPDAWVNGLNTDLTRAIAFHPFAAEQQAVADLIVARLGAGS